MRRILTIIAGGLAFLFVILLLTSCGGSGTGPGGNGNMTKEQQFNQIDQFINLDLDGDDSMVDVNAIFTGQASSPYWDGVDSADVVGSGLLAAPRVPGLGKLSVVQGEDLALAYNPISGWWSISFNAQDDFFGIVVTVHDSVRFETLEGSPQAEPDASTYRFVERGNANLDWQLSGENGAFDLGMNTKINLDVTGLNTALVSVNGSSSGDFDVYATKADTTIDLSFSFTGANQNVTVAGPLPSDGACPNGGSASASLAIDLSAKQGNQTTQASGQWDVAVVFLGDGRGTITVESGDFSHEATGDICE